MSYDISLVWPDQKYWVRHTSGTEVALWSHASAATIRHILKKQFAAVLLKYSNKIVSVKY